MNQKQIKSAIRTFRHADVSIIKDDALREKARKLQKQKGFTLLELLVVITLLATLAVGAMVAYEGIGENAKDVAAANNIASAENMIRNYRAVEGQYPTQWDNLANVDGTTTAASGAMNLLAPETKAFFGQWSVPLTTAQNTASVWSAVAKSLGAVGAEQFQAVDSGTTFTADVIPNLAFNESSPYVTANPGSELELTGDASGALYGGATVASANVAVSIVPSADGTTTSCSADGQNINAAFDGTTVADNGRLNLINDGMNADNCQLVIAVGFGKDVPGSTLGSRVAIAQAPTATSANINPAKNYARYIALFRVASDDPADGGNGDGTIQANEVFPKARLVGLVDPEGRVIDQAIAGANATN